MFENFKPSDLRNPNPVEEQEEIKVSVEKGDTIESVAQKMIRAVKPDSFVSAVYDGIELIAGGGTAPDEIVRQYNEAKGTDR